MPVKSLRVQGLGLRGDIGIQTVMLPIGLQFVFKGFVCLFVTFICHFGGSFLRVLSEEEEDEKPLGLDLPPHFLSISDLPPSLLPPPPSGWTNTLQSQWGWALVHFNQHIHGPRCMCIQREWLVSWDCLEQPVFSLKCVHEWLIGVII